MSCDHHKKCGDCFSPAHVQRLENLIAALTPGGRMPQRQDALDDQLQDLQQVANRLGMYDAADFLAGVLEKKPVC